MQHLLPGMSLNREYPSGKNHKVTVLENGYRYKGKKYPTLYAVTTEITGTVEYEKQLDKFGERAEGTRKMSNWSAPKFWKLKSALSDLGIL